MSNNNNNSNTTSIKRLMKDINIMKSTTLPGLSASPLEEDIFTWHATVQILSGIYEGCNIHLIIKFPDDYPFQPPLIYVHSGQSFNRNFHSHIYEHELGYSICNDMTANFKSHFSDKIGYGWSPGLTLEDLLMNMQIFLSEPDFAKPSNDAVLEMKKTLKTFECVTCKYKNNNSNNSVIAREGFTTDTVTVTDTTDVNEQVADITVDTTTIAITTSHASRVDASRVDSNANASRVDSNDPLVSKLICSITKECYNSNPNMILGYPLFITKDKYNRMHITPILELISYDAFMCEIQKESSKLDNYETVKFRSATGHYYNHWLPIYLNEEHFEKSRITIQNSLTVIRYGVEGKKENDFTPDVVLKVLPTLLNKTILALIKKDIHGSTNAIEVYGHFLHLFMAYLELYPTLYNIINDEVLNFMVSQSYRNKKNVPDMGEFIIKLFLSKYEYGNRKLKRALIDEHFSRQMQWIYKDEPTYQHTSIKPDMLPRIFELKEISLKMMAFNVKAAQYFIKSSDASTIGEIKKTLDQTYGYPDDIVVKNFQKEINNIEAINNYASFLKVVEWDHDIRGTFSLCGKFNDGKRASELQGYTTSKVKKSDEDRKQDWNVFGKLRGKKFNDSDITPYTQIYTISK
jgi:ubiquitin-protein ligase